MEHPIQFSITVGRCWINEQEKQDSSSSFNFDLNSNYKWEMLLMFREPLHQQ